MSLQNTKWQFNSSVDFQGRTAKNTDGTDTK